VATQNTQFSFVTFLQAEQELALRLSDPSNDFWSEAELKLYIQESLSFWNVLTAYWPQTFTFGVTAPLSSNWIPTNTSGPREQSYTDATLYAIMLYHILEPQLSAGAWDGTDQFSLSDLTQAIQRRRDEVLQATGANMADLTPNITPGTDNIFLLDSVLDVRRVRYIGVDGTSQTLAKGDALSFMRFSPSYRQTSGTPQRYDVLGSAPLEVTVDKSPNQPAKLHILALQAGNTLAPPTATPLQVPNDWAWGIKYGALADILGKESEATDRERAAYCEKRYQDFLKLVNAMPWLLQAFINEVAVDTTAVISKDRYSYEWENNPNAMPGIVIGGVDLIAVSPVPTGTTTVSVTLQLLGNAPQPSADGDFIQVPRDVLDVLLDYAQHIASFKMGGAEFKATTPLYQNIIRYALQTSLRLRRSGIFATDLRPPVSKQDLADPRSDQQGG
jgi:hypothetical protein